MSVLSDATEQLHRVLWADAELSDIQIDYDRVCLLIDESTGARKRVICEGHIGFELVGFWDEVLIKAATVAAEGDLLQSCAEAIERRRGRTPLPSGSEARNHTKRLQFTLTLDDGCELKIAMSALRVESVF